jgi:hypothetical protein
MLIYNEVLAPLKGSHRFGQEDEVGTEPPVGAALLMQAPSLAVTRQQSVAPVGCGSLLRASLQVQIQVQALRFHGRPKMALALLCRIPTRPVDGREFAVEALLDLPSLGEARCTCSTSRCPARAGRPRPASPSRRAHAQCSRLGEERRSCDGAGRHQGAHHKTWAGGLLMVGRAGKAHEPIPTSSALGDGWNPGHRRRNASSSSPLSTRVRACKARCAPRRVQRIDWRLPNCLETT